MSLPAARVPCVWVVASHRELGNEYGHPQRYTVMDEAGTRTLVNLGLQPVCFPRVPAGRLDLVLEMVDGVLLGGSATNVHPRHYGEEPVRAGMRFDEARDAVALPLASSPGRSSSIPSGPPAASALCARDGGVRRCVPGAVAGARAGVDGGGAAGSSLKT